MQLSDLVAPPPHMPDGRSRLASKMLLLSALESNVWGKMINYVNIHKNGCVFKYGCRQAKSFELLYY
jgi:hypothetical protein